MDLLDIHEDGVNSPDLRGDGVNLPDLREKGIYPDLSREGATIDGEGVNSTPFLMERVECPHQTPLSIQNSIGEGVWGPNRAKRKLPRRRVEAPTPLSSGDNSLS